MNEFATSPSAVILALWLNAARGGYVSSTDAANACETVTDQVGYVLATQPVAPSRNSWAVLVAQAISAQSPVTVGLPVSGDPAGVPADVLSRIKTESGVVAITRSLLLAQDLFGDWVIFETTHNIAFQDLSSARQQLADAITEAAQFLESADLIGDSQYVVAMLDDFRLLHLPPHLIPRHVAAFELGARIRIVASGALYSSIAIASPSTDKLRMEVLRGLDRQARNLLQAVANC